MIKKLLLLLVITIITSNLFAQNRNRGQTPAAPVLAIPLREVSGVVRDTSDNSIIGASITLTSKKDTLRTATNSDGVFVFKNVKMATFVVTITELGFIPSTRKYLQNDAVKKLVLEPIILKSSSHMMNEVDINGTPSIVYKVDTVEYKASDYKVHVNSTVDELLKHMEGFEVGSDGTVTHQGQQITKAKLNGKIYASGDVATAIQNLPADIVDKIQVVDDYGDLAARTGIKDGDPQKVLNITTRTDRSVGTTGRIILRDGNDDRYYGNLFVQRINANEQLGLIGNYSNTVNGVASTGIAGGATNGGGGGSGVGAGARASSSPGTTQSGGPQINYRDQWGKKVQVVFGYGYNFNNNNSINNSNGLSNTTYGANIFTNQNTSEKKSKSHNLNFEMDYDIDSANYLQITPTFSYSSATNSTNGVTDNINDFTNIVPGYPPPPGFSHPVATNISNGLNSAPNYGLTVIYQHIFKKPRRNIGFQFSITKSNSQANSEKNNDTKYYLDSTRDVLVKDSLSHLLTNRNSINTTYRTSATYVEPIGPVSQFEFNGQVRKSDYANTAITDTVLADGQVEELNLRSNIYNYSFTEARATFNYRYNGAKVNLSLGGTLDPTTLQGTKVNTGNSSNISTTHSDFRVIPVFRFSYSWSRTERFSLNYSGTNTEPSFQEIQPFTDISDPNNIVVGNPNLKPTFANSINAIYNNYIANSKLNISFNANATLTDNQIAENVLLLPQKIISGKDTVNRTINQINYLNLNGSKAYVGRYNISKQLDDRRYNLALNGNITYGYNVNMDNGMEYHSTTWRFDERFGPRIDPTESIEINPYIGYDLSRSFNSLPVTNPNIKTSTQVQTTSLAVDGKMYFFDTYQVNYSATKSYVTGLGNLSTNPLVINAGFEKEFLKKKNLVLTFNVYDILHQNNFVQQSITAQGYTNTLSNSLSRYFLFGVRLNLQKWSGAPKRNGKEMKRRGDGSFIY
jgi:hypothetical protein